MRNGRRALFGDLGGCFIYFLLICVYLTINNKKCPTIYISSNGNFFKYLHNHPKINTEQTLIYFGILSQPLTLIIICDSYLLSHNPISSYIICVLDRPMSNNHLSQAREAHPAKQPITSQTIFKYINIVLVLVLVFCIKGFLNFRDYCIQKGYYVFAVDSLIWCAVGFAGIFIVKYSYYALMKNKIEAILHPKYQGEERIYKLNSVLKLSLDSIFYTFTSIFALVLFRKEYWFPSIVGGCGECGQIYRQYPNWPQSAASNLEMYFMIQLGVHFFSVFEMIVIKRKSERKFYEYLLHHFVAASLILFSMMCNQITAGSMVLIVHDMSDIMIAFGRAFVETKYNVKMGFGVAIYALMTGIWIYLRIFVFPFCLLANVYANKPTPQDEWYMISFQYSYLLTMAFVLYGMHLFWTYFLIKLGIRSATGKNLKNVHDASSVKEK